MLCSATSIMTLPSFGVLICKGPKLSSKEEKSPGNWGRWVTITKDLWA